MRLANYSIQLDVPEDTPEPAVGRMCRALSLLDLRSVLEEIVAAYTGGNHALQDVRVVVEE
jgi:hypothetical protein